MTVPVEEVFPHEEILLAYLDSRSDDLRLGAARVCSRLQDISLNP